jgi:hypothetical protein
VAQGDGQSQEDLGLTSRIAQEAKDAGLDVADIFADDADDAPDFREDRTPQPEASANVDGGPDVEPAEPAEDKPPAEAVVEAEPEVDSAAPAELAEGSIEARLATLETELGQARSVNRTLQAEKDRQSTRVKELESQDFDRTQADEKASLDRIANMSDVDKVGWVESMVEKQRQPLTTQQLEARVMTSQYENRIRGVRSFYPEGDKGTNAWQADIVKLEGPEGIDSLIMELAQKEATKLLTTDREATAVAAAAAANPSEEGVVDTGAKPGRKVATYDQLIADFASDDSDFGREDGDIDVVLEAAAREGKTAIVALAEQRFDAQSL